MLEILGIFSLCVVCFCAGGLYVCWRVIEYISKR